MIRIRVVKITITLGVRFFDPMSMGTQTPLPPALASHSSPVSNTRKPFWDVLIVFYTTKFSVSFIKFKKPAEIGTKAVCCRIIMYLKSLLLWCVGWWYIQVSFSSRHIPNLGTHIQQKNKLDMMSILGGWRPFFEVLVDGIVKAHLLFKAFKVWGVLLEIFRHL